MNVVWTDVILPAVAAAVIGIAGFLGAQLQAAWKRVATDKTKKSVAKTVVLAVEQM